MKAFIGIVVITALILLAAMIMSGCAPAHPDPAAVVAPTGTDIDKAGAYTDSAESAVQAAVPHTDAAGKEDLGLASSAHKSVTGSLGRAKADLMVIQNTLTSEQRMNDGLQNQVNSLEASWGHKLQVWVTWAFWILVALVAVHLIAGALAIFVPAWAPIAGLISKIVNPLGWTTWVVAHMTAPVVSAQAAATKATPF